MTANRRQWLAYGGAAAVAAGAGLALWRHREQPQVGVPATGEVPDALWSLRLPRPGGGELALAALRGKPTLVNFWATWCPPCVEEMPLLDRFHRENTANGWQVVGIAVDRAEPVDRFLARLPVVFPIGIAGAQALSLVRALGNDSGGLPFTLVLDSGGAVRDRRMGKVEPADLQAWQRAVVHG
ncbi:MAG: TlpA family protein disulfide reductase [Gammaproteobacteria bacterium]